MDTNTSTKGYTSSQGITYHIIFSQDTEVPRRFGITAIMDTDADDCASVENIFFTEAEATAYCRWLAENDVFPVSLCDVLANIYIL